MREIAFDNLHHAYLLVGSQAEAEALVHNIFEEAGEPLAGSPDFFVFKEGLFGIDAARELAGQAARRAFRVGGKKVFFLAPETITPEAQNALLKTFEEPGPETHFFLALRDDGTVLPTLRSRVKLVRLGESEMEGSGEKFLKLPLKERLAFVKKFVDNEKNLSAFLDELLRALRASSASPASLEEVYRARLVSDQRGAGARLILEHLALSL